MLVHVYKRYLEMGIHEDKEIYNSSDHNLLDYFIFPQIILLKSECVTCRGAARLAHQQLQ